MSRGAYLMNLGRVPYREAWDLQRSVAAAVSQGAVPDTVLLLEHPPVITLGRRAEEGELHVPEGADVEIVETDRGGKSTYHGPGQLVCYPILDLTRYGQDVKRYCRDLEEALIRTLGAVGVEATRIEGLTGIWVERSAASGVPLASVGRGDSATGTAPRLERGQRRERPAEPGFARREPAAASGGGPRKIASIGVHISKWVTTHGYALNVDLDTAPFTQWITACGLADASFTTIADVLGRPVTIDELRPHAAAALEEVFGLTFSELPADEGHGLWPQPLHEKLHGKPTGAAPAGVAQGVEQVVAGR
ncbi:MAG TPA: lipoyl(octanoyl) transferase LipB [Gaiellaceae bacterium]|nr:lipoyl(octanoyl) transferase LipB [Gaiellaceae bacterium]